MKHPRNGKRAPISMSYMHDLAREPVRDIMAFLSGKVLISDLSQLILI